MKKQFILQLGRTASFAADPSQENAGCKSIPVVRQPSLDTRVIDTTYLRCRYNEQPLSVIRSVANARFFMADLKFRMLSSLHAALPR